MSELFGMIRKLAHKPANSQTSPFSTVRTARQWLHGVPKTSDYDAHHALVEGLERFNADTRGDLTNRVKVLRVLEEAGLPFQARIVDQYLRNQEVLKFAKESLWRESQMFWSQLSAAYLHLFKQIIKGAEKERLKPWRAEIILKCLHYTAMCIRWEYYRGQRASGLIWRRMHKIYRMAEISGVALTELAVGDRSTSCAREYVQALILELANPPGFRPREIHLIVQMLEAIDPLPVPEIKLRRNQHTHCVDMSSPMGAEKLEDRWIHGRRLRYLDLGGVTEHIEQRASQVAEVERSSLFHQFARVINRGGIRRDRARRRRTGEIWVAEGLESVMTALAGNEKKQMELSSWSLRDESRDGLGFVIEGEKMLPIGRLVLISSLPGEEAWKLLAVRWVRHEHGQTLIGAQYLSRHPKPVVVETGGCSVEPAPRSQMAIFVPLADTRQGMISNLLLPVGAYSAGAAMTMRDGNVTYTLKLGKIVETHEEDWVRVSFDVLAREIANQMPA